MNPDDSRTTRNTARRAVLAFFTAFALVGTLRAGVLVVSNAGGAPHTTIQSAVDAAVDGDVILVRQGAIPYSGFTVTDKDLVVVGDTPTFFVRVQGRVVVQNLAATRTVVLGWLDIGLSSSPTPIEGLVASGISGQLRVQRCAIRGATGEFVSDPLDPQGYGMGSDGGRAVSLLASTGGVAFVNCTLNGGLGGGVGGTGATQGGRGGDGIRCEDARVVVYDGVVRGGDAGDGSYSGNDAGSGARVSTASLPTHAFASNTSFTGGRGSMGEDLGHNCLGPGGDGGDGLWLGPGATGWQLASLYAAGLGQCGTPPGQPGQPLTNLGSLATFNATSVRLVARPLVRAGTTMDFTFSGTPGDVLYLARSRRTSFDGLASWRGFFLARPVGLNLAPQTPTPIATIPGSGTITVNLPAPELGAGELERTLHYQVYRQAANGSITLGSYAAVTVVDPAF